MSRAAIRFAPSLLLACAALLGHSTLASAAVSAGDATYTYALAVGVPPPPVTIFFNVTENNDSIGNPLVSGSPRPLQLIDAVSSDSAVMVSRMRNCITLTFQSPGPSTFMLTYTMADGSNPGSFATDTGTITFFGSSTASYSPPTDPRCGDSQFAFQAVVDSVQTQVNQTVLIPVVDNDVPQGAPNHHVIFAPGAGDNDQFQTTTPNGGTASARPDNQISYTPAPGYVGTDIFTYILEDYAQPGFEILNASAAVAVTVLAPFPPPRVVDAQLLVNGSANTDVFDSNQQPGEVVNFELVATDPSTLAGVVNFAWFVGKETVPRQSNPSRTFATLLQDGPSDIKVVGTDAQGLMGTKLSTVNVAPPPVRPPGSALQILVNGTPNTTVVDSDSLAGETVRFEVATAPPATSPPAKPAGAAAPIVDFIWFVGNEPTPRQQGQSPQFMVALPDGLTDIRVLVTDELNQTATQVITVSVLPVGATGEADGQILVNGGTSTLVPDSDSLPGETVGFEAVPMGSSTDIDIVDFAWFVANEPTPRQTGASTKFSVALPNGVTEIKVVGTNAQNEMGQKTITVTVAAPPVQPPLLVDVQILINSGTATAVLDTDKLAGETVNFEATSSELATLTNFAWFVGNNANPRQSSASPKFSLSLPDGASDIKVVASDPQGKSSSKSVTVTVGASPPMLSELPNLQPNQMGVAGALDRMCGPSTSASTTAMSDDQQDALARCNAIAGADMASQMRALDELSAMDFNGSRTQTLLFTKSTYSGVSDRLGALRGGARGVSLKGVNLIIDGKAIPVAELQRMVGKILGAGASADEPGSLLGDKWGQWTRGNMTFGKKSASGADNGFRADQFSFATGTDYRLTNDSVIGGSLSYGSSKVAYNPVGEGGLDTKSWALALYGTSYLFKRAYLDGVINFSRSSYGSDRHINYSDSIGLVDRNAKGSTDGVTWSGGVSGGYDFAFGGFTLSPNGSVFYTDSGINGFRERGAGGLDLAYEDQSFQSMTATAGLRISYAVKLPVGVVLPYLRADLVRELDSNAAIFNVSFANDLDGSNSPIAVQSDAPDQSYWRLSGGMSAQLPLGFSGYVEYQRLESMELVEFEDFALGLRMQYQF